MGIWLWIFWFSSWHDHKSILIYPLMRDLKKVFFRLQKTFLESLIFENLYLNICLSCCYKWFFIHFCSSAWPIWLQSVQVAVSVSSWFKSEPNRFSILDFTKITPTAYNSSNIKDLAASTLSDRFPEWRPTIPILSVHAEFYSSDQ